MITINDENKLTIFEIASNLKGRSKLSKKQRKHAFILFLILIIVSTYGNLHAYPYGYHLFVSEECKVWLHLMPRINQISWHI